MSERNTDQGYQYLLNMNSSILPKINKYIIYVFIFALLSIFVVHLVNGDKNLIQIYDNLDSEITTRLLPKQAGNLYSISNESIVPQAMNGLKRNSFNASATNIETTIFYFFSPIYFYLLNFIIINAIAFAGVYLLFSRYIFAGIKDQNKILASLLAFSFILLPAFTIYGMAVLGSPLLLYCILNIVNGKRSVFNYLFIAIYPFYSSLVLGGHVVLVLLFVAGLIYYFIKKNKKAGLQFMGIAVAMGFLYLISEINLINQFLFDSDFVSHRTAWDPTFDQISQTSETLGFTDAFRRVINFIQHGEINAKVYPIPILIFLVVLLVFNFKSLIRNKYILPIFTGLILISLLYGFYFSDLKPWVYLKNQFILLKTFRIDRIFFFWSVFWYIMFAFMVKNAFDSKKKFLIVTAYVFVIFNLLNVAQHNRNIKSNTAIFLGLKNHSMISYKKFFAEDLFNKIKADIKEPLDSFRTINIGFVPAVSQYNGFYTLDNYSNNYPLSYKKDFRRIVAPELEKSEKWRTSFDKWGGECFVFTSEIEYRYEFIPAEKSLKKLEINTEALYEMGGRYVLSALDIENNDENYLEFLKKYTDENTPLVIYLYKVIPPAERF